MEQLWKDVTNSNIQNGVFPLPTTPANAAAPFSSSVILQDYLAGHFAEPHSPEHLTFLPAAPSARRAERCAVEEDACGGDRRQKRMIKNRESAGRSRARKQAYAKELELEISQLSQQNAALRKEHEELKIAMAGKVFSKGKFRRGSSA